MNPSNPYQAPGAELLLENSGPLLASRWARLSAALIDVVIMLVVAIPAAFLIGSVDRVMQGLEPTLMQQVLGGIIGVAAFLLVNGYLLKTYGQTVGKRLVRIAIVDLEGRKPAWLPMLGKRYVILWVVSAIPFIGGVSALVDCLFIFRADRRCLHDLLAGTRVVQLPL